MGVSKKLLCANAIGNDIDLATVHAPSGETATNNKNDETMDDWLIDKLASEYEENGCGRFLPTSDEKLHDYLYPRATVLDNFFGGPTSEQLKDISPLPKGCRITDPLSSQSRYFATIGGIAFNAKRPGCNPASGSVSEDDEMKP